MTSEDENELADAKQDTQAAATDFIAEAITEAFGERCPDYAEGCAACDTWKQYDDLCVASQAKPAADAVVQWQVWAEDDFGLAGWVNEDVEMIDHWRSKGRKVRALYAAPSPATPVEGLVTKSMVDAGCKWFDDNFNGLPNTEALVRGVLTAALQGGEDLVERGPSYDQIIALVNDCVERMKLSGESYPMLAKWISEGLNAALSQEAGQ